MNENIAKNILKTYSKRRDDSIAYFKAIRKLGKEMGCEYLASEVINLYWKDSKKKDYEEQESQAINFIWDNNIKY